MKTLPRLLALFGLVLTLSSCSLIKAPFQLLNRAASAVLAPVGGLGGAAQLAPLLLDAKDGQRKPIKGMERSLDDGSAPSQQPFSETKMARSTPAQSSSGAEG